MGTEIAAGSLVLERRLYYGTRFFAQTAQNLFFVGLFLAAGASTALAADPSSPFVAMLVAAILFGFAGGAAADRIGAHRGLAVGAILRLVPAIAALALLDGGQSAWILAFAYSAASQLFTPAEMALVRTLRRSAPGEAHSVLVGLQYGGQAVAMLGLAPVLYVLGGAEAILALSAAGLAVTACLACVLAFRVGRIAPVKQPHLEPFTTSRETLTFFWREWRARYAVVVLAMKAIVLRGLLLAVPIYVTADIGFGQEAVAFLFVPGVLGFALGLAWAGRTVRVGEAAPTMRMALMGMVIGILALAVLDYGLTIVAVGSQVPPLVQLEASVNTTFIVALPAAVLLGLSLGAALVAARVALTETAPSTQQSRVFAVQMTLTDSLIVVPLVLMGVGTEFAGARVTLGFLGALAALAVVALELPRWQAKQQPVEPEQALVIA